MKQSFWDRLLTGLAGLILVTLGIGLFVFGVGFFPFTLDLSFFDGPFTFWQHVLMVAAALVLLLLGARGVARVFRSNREKGFILQRTEYGDLNISMNAMENMVKKCVDMNDELKVTQTKIHHTREGVIVSIRILLENGVNIPMIVSALQKQTKQYITSCSGVDVKEVRVFVDTHLSAGLRGLGDKPGDIAAAEKANRMVDRLNDSVQKAIQADAGPQAEVEKKEPLHQRIFRKREEEPADVDAAPETQAAEEAAPDMEPEPEAKAQKGAKKNKKNGFEPQDKEDAQ